MDSRSKNSAPQTDLAPTAEWLNQKAALSALTQIRKLESLDSLELCMGQDPARLVPTSRVDDPRHNLKLLCNLEGNVRESPLVLGTYDYQEHPDGKEEHVINLTVGEGLDAITYRVYARTKATNELPALKQEIAPPKPAPVALPKQPSPAPAAPAAPPATRAVAPAQSPKSTYTPPIKEQAPSKKEEPQPKATTSPPKTPPKNPPTPAPANWFAQAFDNRFFLFGRKYELDAEEAKLAINSLAKVATRNGIRTRLRTISDVTYEGKVNQMARTSYDDVRKDDNEIASRVSDILAHPVSGLEAVHQRRWAIVRKHGLTYGSVEKHKLTLTFKRTGSDRFHMPDLEYTLSFIHEPGTQKLSPDATYQFLNSLQSMQGVVSLKHKDEDVRKKDNTYTRKTINSVKARDPESIRRQAASLLTDLGVKVGTNGQTALYSQRRDRLMRAIYRHEETSTGKDKHTVKLVYRPLDGHISYLPPKFHTITIIQKPAPYKK